MIEGIEEHYSTRLMRRFMFYSLPYVNSYIRFFGGEKKITIGDNKLKHSCKYKRGIKNRSNFTMYVIPNYNEDVQI